MARNHVNRMALVIVAAAGMAGSAAAGDLFVAGADGTIWHMDSATGALDSPVSSGGSVAGLALQGREVLAAVSSGEVRRIDLDTGELVDSFATVGEPLSLVRFGNTLYLTTTGGDMQWITADDGSEIDTYYVHDALRATVLFGNTIYTGSWSTLVYTTPVGDLNLQLFAACGGSVNSAATDGTDLLLGTLQGTVYIFDADTGQYKATWSVPSDCVGMAYVDDRLFIAGSDGEVHRMNLANGQIEDTIDTGMGLTAMIAAEPCAADFNGDGQISTLDFLAFLNAWTAKEPSADFDGNGTINTQDFLLFLNAFTAGCE